MAKHHCYFCFFGFLFVFVFILMKRRASHCSPVSRLLVTKHEVLVLIPTLQNISCLSSCLPSIKEARGSKVQDHNQLHTKTKNWGGGERRGNWDINKLTCFECSSEQDFVSTNLLDAPSMRIGRLSKGLYHKCTQFCQPCGLCSDYLSWFYTTKGTTNKM